MHQRKTLTKDAQHCLSHAVTYASSQGQKSLSGDALFRGVIHFLIGHEKLDLFTKILDLDASQIEAAYAQQVQAFFPEKKSTKKQMPLTAKLNKNLKEFVNQKISKFDGLFFFYLSLFNLSKESKAALGRDIKTLNRHKKTCVSLLQHPLIQQVGIFAFLDVLTTLVSQLGLDPKSISLMDTHDPKNHINLLLDQVESDIADTPAEPGTKKSKKNEKKLNVEFFGTDLTDEAKSDSVDPIIGRDKEIEQVIFTLLRKNKNNPLLIGEAGVGKTAIVEWLAQRIASGSVPQKLQNKRLFLLDMGAIVAGTKYRGEFESRMKSVIDEAMDPQNNIILFIDEIHSIIGAGNQENSDAAQLLKPALARGKLKLIGATTHDEYQKYIEKDAALKRRFQEISVNEPDSDTTAEIITGLQPKYEDFHGIKLTPDVISHAIELSQRYLVNRHLPDKALDLIDEACARKSARVHGSQQTDTSKLEKKLETLEEKIEKAISQQDYFYAADLKKELDELKKSFHEKLSHHDVPEHLRPAIELDDIGEVIAAKIGVPSSVITEDERSKLKNFKKTLDTKILGQDEAVDAVVKTLTRSRLSVVQRNRPLGSFLFLGPSGVGKTLLAKLIAQEFFGDPAALIRLDMSEFMEKYSVSKLVGSPAGYVGYDEGGNLTEKVRRRPYSVILLDEIEKASPDVLNILLQVLDEGKLTDSKGRLIDFKSTVIVMTSNLGAEEFARKIAQIGFADAGSSAEQNFSLTKERVLEKTKEFFRPELLNRIDHQVVFRPLERSVFDQILKKELDEFLAQRAGTDGLTLPKFGPKKLTEIAEKIYDPQFGARPIGRYLHGELEHDIVQKLLK